MKMKKICKSPCIIGKTVIYYLTVNDNSMESGFV